MAPRGSRQDPDAAPDVRRIRAQYKALKRGLEYDTNLGAIYLRLARKWKRPVSEIKRIVRGPKMRNIVTVIYKDRTR